MFKSWYVILQIKKCKTRIDSGPGVKGLCALTDHITCSKQTPFLMFRYGKYLIAYKTRCIEPRDCWFNAGTPSAIFAGRARRTTATVRFRFADWGNIVISQSTLDVQFLVHGIVFILFLWNAVSVHFTSISRYCMMSLQSPFCDIDHYEHKCRFNFNSRIYITLHSQSSIDHQRDTSVPKKHHADYKKTKTTNVHSGLQL